WSRHCSRTSNSSHTNPTSGIRQRLAPAALVYAFAEGLLVQSTMQHTGLALLHMELNVENPVFAGDTIHAECEVIEARRSRRRSDRGLVRTRVRVVKQDGAVALTYTPLRMVRCRESATTTEARRTQSYFPSGFSAVKIQSRSSGTIQNGFWPRATRSKLSNALRQRFQ